MVTSWVLGWLAACTCQGPAPQQASAPEPAPEPPSPLAGTAGSVLVRDGVPSGVGRVTCSTVAGPDPGPWLLVDVPTGLGLRRASVRAPATDGDHPLGPDVTVSWSDGPTSSPVSATGGVVTVRGREVTVTGATVGGVPLALRATCPAEAGPTTLTLDGAPLTLVGPPECVTRPQLAVVAATTQGPLRVALGGSAPATRAVVRPGALAAGDAAVDLTLVVGSAVTPLASAPGGTVALAVTDVEWALTLDGVALAGPTGPARALAGTVRCAARPAPAPWTGPTPEPAATAPALRLDGVDQPTGTVMCGGAQPGGFDVTVLPSTPGDPHVRLSLPGTGWPTDGAWLLGADSGALLHVMSAQRTFMASGGVVVARTTDGLLHLSATSVPAEQPTGELGVVDLAVDCVPPVEVGWTTSTGERATLVQQLPECRRVAGALQAVAATQWGSAQSVFAVEVPEAPAQPTSWPLSDAIAPGTGHAGLQEHPLPQGSGPVRAWFSAAGQGEVTASVGAHGVLTMEVTGATLAPLGEGAPLPFTGRVACRLAADQRP